MQLPLGYRSVFTMVSFDINMWNSRYLLRFIEKPHEQLMYCLRTRILKMKARSKLSANEKNVIDFKQYFPRYPS